MLSGNINLYKRHCRHTQGAGKSGWLASKVLSLVDVQKAKRDLLTSIDWVEKNINTEAEDEDEADEDEDEDEDEADTEAEDEDEADTEAEAEHEDEDEDEAVSEAEVQAEAQAQLKKLYAVRHAQIALLSGGAKTIHN